MISNDDSAVVDWYARRAANFQSEAERLGRRAELLAAARLTVFLVCVLCAAWLFGLSSRAPMAATSLVASVVVFMALVATHRRARNEQARARELCELNLRGVARVRREWASLPATSERTPPDHPYAADLDVLGSSASLYRLLDVVSDATGRPVLFRWLLHAPPSVAELTARHDAVSELAKATELRENLALLARRTGRVEPERFDDFLAWAEGGGTLQHEMTLVWGARVIPVLTLAATLAAFFRWVPWLAPTLTLLTGLVLLGRYRGLLASGLTSVLTRGTGLRAQREMLELIASRTFVTPLLVELRQRTRGGASALRGLERALTLLEGRGSLIHAIANTLVLWDVHALGRLDRWRERHGRRVRGCLAALGEVEALGALGMLAHDNPAWTFPVFDNSDRRLRARDLGHPLIASSLRIGNDVTVGPPGTLLLVTGSNMSGKSTLLRAIGLNAVLAQAGAPVCAASLTMPLVELRTSIRLADSLERGVSLFMAELERLKEIVDAARAPNRESPLLYLLDEILHGTNTAERLIAARVVLGQLVHARAIGAVTTHDLTLAADGELASASHAVHFTEQVSSTSDGPNAGMTFDYRLRPGLATSTNALKLLALVGLSSD